MLLPLIEVRDRILLISMCRGCCSQVLRFSACRKFKTNNTIRHVIVFRKVPIRCARNRYFEMWESRLAKALLLFDKLWNTRLPDGAIFTHENSALCWPNLLERLYTTKLLQTLHFYSFFICILTLPRLKVLLVDTFCCVIKGQWYSLAFFDQNIFHPLKRTFASSEEFI